MAREWHCEPRAGCLAAFARVVNEGCLDGKDGVRQSDLKGLTGASVTILVHVLGVQKALFDIAGTVCYNSSAP